MTAPAKEATYFRAATVEEERPAMRAYLLRCRARAEELGQLEREQPLSPQERAQRAAERTERARAALRENGPAYLMKLGVGTAQAEIVLNRLEHWPLVQKVAAWWRTSTKAFCVIGGASGTGKTIAALALVPEVCARCLELQSGEEFWGWEPSALVLPATEISQQSFFDRTDRGARERAKTRRLLVIDDLGAEVATETVKQTLLEVLDARLNNGRKTVITTNLGGEELKARYQGRILRRLQECGEWLSGNTDGRKAEAA